MTAVKLHLPGMDGFSEEVELPGVPRIGDLVSLDPMPEGDEFFVRYVLWTPGELPYVVLQRP